MADQLKAEPLSEPTWLDAFPWIEADSALDRSDGVSEPWQRQPISHSDKTQQREIIARLSAMALERLSRWTIGQLFPGVSSDLPLSSLPFNSRARQVLDHQGLQLAGDLQALELADLLGLSNLGVGTVDLILRVMGEVAIDSALPALPSLSLDDQTSPSEAATIRNSRLEAVLDDLRAIARWQVAIGTEDQPLLAPGLAAGTPAAIIEARQRLDRIHPSDVLESDDAHLDAAALFGRSISLLDERQQLILARRLFADQPETLDQLGSRLELTRERVRQIESMARSKMARLLQAGGQLELVAQGVRDLVETVLPLADLLEHLPALACIVEPVGQPVWRILDRLDDNYEIVDDWCASPSVQAARAGTEARLQELANPYGVVPIEDLGSLNPHLAHASDNALRSWLQDCDCAIHDDFVLIRTQSLGDRAAAILSIVGAPLPAEEILARLDIERSVGSLKNAMSVDERIERVDRDQWALVEWGLDAYIGVRALVKEELARSGGQIPMDLLVERITSKYSVSASSVVAYASAPPFEARESIVRLRSSPGHRKTPQETRRLYRRGAEWLYRVQITKEHLRGSGTVAPMAITGILGLEFGDTCTLESPIGNQVISWTGLQPAFGSIRRLLIKHDIAAGTDVFLIMGDDRTFDFELVGILTGEPLADALALVGITAAGPDTQARQELAAAIGLIETVSTSDLFAAYRNRGDGDLADLLLACRDQLSGDLVDHRQVVPAPEIDEILDLLDG